MNARSDLCPSGCTYPLPHNHGEWVLSNAETFSSNQDVLLEHGDGSRLKGTVSFITATGPSFQALPRRVTHISTCVATRSPRDWRSLGWTVFVQAKPTPTLPTEDGWYSVDREGHPYCRLLRLKAGVWTEAFTDGIYAPRRLAELAVAKGRLTPLAPVTDTAKKVLERIRANMTMLLDGSRPDGRFQITTEQLDRIAAEFGVTL